MKDLNGNILKAGQVVLVPDPDETALHNHSFTGNVYDFHNNYVTVIDGDGECWDIEPERLILK